MDIINEKHKITMPIRDYERILSDKKLADKQLDAVWETMKPDMVSYYDYNKNQRVILYRPDETNAVLVKEIERISKELVEMRKRRDEIWSSIYQYSRHWFLKHFIKLP